MVYQYHHFQVFLLLMIHYIFVVGLTIYSLLNSQAEELKQARTQHGCRRRFVG